MNKVFNQAIERLLDDEKLHDFCNWFALAMAAELHDAHPMDSADAADLLRYQRHTARQLWGQMPVPSNRWRPRGLPKTERNAPCHCGSGHKFKQCCAEFEHLALPLEPEQLLVMGLNVAQPHWLTADKLRHVPAMALGHAAMNWNEAGAAEKTVALLMPLFTPSQASTLDARHEVALDALGDALRELQQDRQRRELLERMAQHNNKALATAARARLVSVLADAGEEQQAWQLFHETSRFNPNDPQLWPLELTLLLTQNRQKEAKLRAPLLAARARQAGLNDLATTLLRMAQLGIDSVYELSNGGDDPVQDEDELAWLALADATPEALDATSLNELYQIERHRLPQDDGASTFVVSITPTKPLVDLNKRWRRRFMLGKPDLTWLDGDVLTLLESLPDALRFLQKNPLAWLSTEVLDDLLLVAYELCDPDAPRPLFKAAQRVADHALALLRALTDGAQCHWADPNHRPPLRCLAVAVKLCHLTMDKARALELMRWGLALNPHDNHGWRLELAPLLLELGQHQEALDLMAQYPDDLPPSEHLRAVALFALGQREQAEAVLQQAHHSYPLYLNTLLPDTMDAPPEEDGPGVKVGGLTSAWYHRRDWRPLWVRTGALAWARALRLPDPPPPALPKQPQSARSARSAKASKATKPTKAGQAPPAGTKASSDPMGAAKLLAPFGAREEKRLQKTCSQTARLRGFLLGVAWSPGRLMPSAWINKALQHHDRMPNSRTEATAMKALNDVLALTMRLYNHLTQQVLNQLDAPKPPTVDYLSAAAPGHAVDDAAACAWAAGFIEGCELSLAGWARAGHKVAAQTGPFGRLRALAARAAVADGQSRLLHDSGAPLLLAVDEPEPFAPQIAAALAELWPVVVADRKARA